MSDPPILIPRKRFWIKDGNKVFAPMDYLEMEDLQEQRLITVRQLVAETSDGPWFHVHEALFLDFLAVEAKYWYWLKPGNIDDMIQVKKELESVDRKLKFNIYLVNRRRLPNENLGNLFYVEIYSFCVSN